MSSVPTPPDQLDALVNLGPSVPETQKGSLTVTGLLGELEEVGLRGSERHIARAALNERFFHGLDLFEEVRDDYVGREARRNYMRNMVQTYSSRFQEDRSTYKAYPNHPEPTDLGGAKVANALIEYHHDTQNLDELFMQSAIYAQLHGKSAFKICWEPTKGKRVWAPKIDELTGYPELDDEGEVVHEDLGAEGEVSWELLTPFDYYYPAQLESVHDSDWVVVRRYVDEYTARGMIHEMTGESAEPGVVTYAPAPGVQAEGVPIHEIWYRRSARIPDGLYALVIGGHVAEHSDFPYNHNELPVAEWAINQVRGIRWATSHVDDAVHIQRRINELEAAQVEFTQKTHHARLLAMPAVFAELGSDVQAISVDNENMVNSGARWIEPPQPPNTIFSQMGELVQAMYDIFGLNEVVTGKDSVKSGTSAKQIAYLNRLDSMKMAVALRSFEVALRRAWRQVFAVTRQYMDGERLVKIVGPSGEIAAHAFTVADIMDVDIHIEPSSGIERWHAQAAAEAEEDLQTGKVSPAEGMERAETGLGETMGDAAARQKASQAVMAAINGQVQPPDPSVPPAVLLDVINQARGIFGEQGQPGLDQLEQMARQAMAASQQGPRMGAPGAGPGPTGAAGPGRIRRPRQQSAAVQLAPGTFTGRP